MTLQNPSASSADTDYSENLDADTVSALSFQQSAETSDAPEQVDSSPTETPEGAKHASLLELVKNVVAETSPEAPPAKDPAEEPEPQKPKSSDTPENPVPSGTVDNHEPKPEEDEKLPFHKHPRWQAVLKERDESREQATAFKEKATQFDAISDYMADSRLTPEEVNRGFEIMAAIRNDPSKAFEMLSETMTFLRGVTGEDLPPDVVQLVEDGEMTEAAGRQLAKARAQVDFQEQRQKEAFEIQRQNQEAYAHHQIIESVQAWEKQVATRDPDYQAKRTLVHQNIRLANLQNPAKTAQEALAIADAALAQATETVRGFRPKPVAMVQPSSSQSLPASQPLPKTMRDVVRGALAID